MLIASGLSVHSREIRPIKFSNPLDHFSIILGALWATNLGRARGKELESVERTRGIVRRDLIRQLHVKTSECT